ncbi:ArnT family glycosyltransferase [Leptospira santarosai]|uniref:ArnT family glycosyltransferase n=1 Tax=Leptospira santarosai TaxID=28183 RepID=UPI0002F9980C|nr:membrane protein [Leptospira santarosai]
MRKMPLFFLLCLPVLYYVGTVLSWEKKKRIPITGDEPHYLMISESIRKDGDFDLKNNYEEDRNTKKIIGPVDVENHTISKNGKLYSIHSIGTSFLALIGYSIFGITGARVALALLAGMIPFLFYRLGKVFGLSPKESAIVAVFYSVSLPFPMAAGQIFPDLPTGILLTSVLSILFFLETKKSFKNRNILFFASGVACGCLAWLHAKNLPVVTLLLFWVLSKKETDSKSKWIFLGTALVFLFFFSVCNFLWFGSIVGPYGENNSPPTFELNFFHWITVFSGLFMDRNQGLFFQNPMIWIFGILGVFALIQDRNFKRIGILVLCVLIVQLGLNAGHPCSYGCLSLPGRFQWSAAVLFFLPVLAGWKGLSSLSKKAVWEVFILCVVYQIWIGKYWFDYTGSLYHVMESDPRKRPGFFPEKILSYLPSWTDPDLSWKVLINWIWIGVFVLSILSLSYLWIRNNRKDKAV